MKAKINSLSFKIIISFYGLLYFIGFIIPLFSNYTSITRVEIYTVPLAFLLFTIGAFWCWYNERIGGYILLGWHLIIWCFAIFLWPDGEMTLVFAFPILIISALLIRNWHKININSYSDSIQQWKLVLRVLLINYVIIYCLVVFSDVAANILGIQLHSDATSVNAWNFSQMETSILVFELLLFMLAAAFSLKSELVAGLLLVIWYVLLAIACNAYQRIGNSGPWTLFSIPIFAQGLLYILIYFRQKKQIILL
ncbi:hypothetical protein OU798_06790 [Prolixibacteraceae bacterium Z1-6]|uniref:Uncharacterized protein n=1 Tax=Draconibacterium aestuarii TaxID=2998507 RepID=A0A9X3F6Z9_9BACT|nr:hypothetical protein [Prolixibacteraceae bacterium Z1-6]